MTYMICFDLPEADDPVFAALTGNGFGFAPSITAALKFRREADAVSTLNDYPSDVRGYGCVVETA